MKINFYLTFILIVLLLSGNATIYGQNETQTNDKSTSTNDQGFDSAANTLLDETNGEPTLTGDLTGDTTLPPTTENNIDQVQQEIEEQPQNTTSTTDEEQEVKDNVVQNMTQKEES